MLHNNNKENNKKLQNCCEYIFKPKYKKMFSKTACKNVDFFLAHLHWIE